MKQTKPRINCNYTGCWMKENASIVSAPVFLRKKRITRPDFNVSKNILFWHTFFFDFTTLWREPRLVTGTDAI